MYPSGTDSGGGAPDVPVGRVLVVELLLKVGYVAGAVLNVVGLVHRSAVLRHVGLPFCAGTLVCLLLSWHWRVGWVNTRYAMAVIAALLCWMLADVVLSQPTTDFLEYIGFLLYLVACALCAGAVWQPTPPPGVAGAHGWAGGDGVADPGRQRLSAMAMALVGGGGDVTTTPPGGGTYGATSPGRSLIAPTTTAAAPGMAGGGGRGLAPISAAVDPVPLRPLRAILPIAGAVTAMVVWRLADGSAEARDPRYIATACAVVLAALWTWRALARVGYAAPWVTVAGLRQAAALRQAIADGTFRWRGVDVDGGGGGLAGRGRPRLHHPRIAAAGGDGDDDDDEDDGDDGFGVRVTAQSLPRRAMGAALPRRGGVKFVREGSEDAMSNPFVVNRDAVDERREGGGRWGGQWQAPIAPTTTLWRGARPPPTPPAAIAAMPSGSTAATVAAAAKVRAERNARHAARDASAAESRWAQLAGVAASVLLTAAVVAQGYDRLWLNDDPGDDGVTGYAASAVSYVHALCTWIGQTLLAVSVPTLLPETGGMSHPALHPPVTEGASLRIAILLPSFLDFDIAEVALPWYYLTKRGHTVVFATRDGAAGVKLRGTIPLPYEPSIHGYTVDRCCGCVGTGTAGVIPPPGAAPGGGGSGDPPAAATASCSAADAGMAVGIAAPAPVVVAVYRDMCEDASFRFPHAWSPTALATAALELAPRARQRHGRRRAAGSRGGEGDDGMGGGGALAAAMAAYQEYLLLPESLDGLIVVGTHPPSPRGAVWEDDELSHFLSRFWATGKPVAAFGTAVLALARLPDPMMPGTSILHDCMVTTVPRRVEWVQRLLSGQGCSGGGMAGGASVAGELTQHLRVSANYVAGAPGAGQGGVLDRVVRCDWRVLRSAGLGGGGPGAGGHNSTVVVQDGSLITAQCGADATQLVAAFCGKVEEAGRSF